MEPQVLLELAGGIFLLEATGIPLHLKLLLSVAVVVEEEAEAGLAEPQGIAMVTEGQVVEEAVVVVVAALLYRL
uniref:Uncharacterized protein n=1 Tax=viral metagenome TaxID=1070528 RepID=A0A6H1ZUW8_9ZZZZ